MANPGDVSELRRLIAQKVIDPAEIVASIGKTEGNGGANDFTRALATQSVADLLAAELGITREEATARAALAWSGGCEGVLSPHMTVFTAAETDDDAPTGGLAISVQRTRRFRPEEVGRVAEVTEVAAAVTRALDELGASPDTVHYVQVKGPLLTPASLADAAARGQEVVTTDPNRSKAYARGATALGVAVALGEVAADRVTDGVIATDMTLYSSVANTSAGGELTDCEVIVFANSPTSTSRYRIGHAVLRDAVDVVGVRDALRGGGLVFDADPDQEQRGRIAAVFAKAEAPPGGLLRGYRTTMLSDADINYERHARAALGAVIASVTSDPRIFVSGGTEHQCPPGQAPIAAIVRLS
jgi:cyanuric acid amidohydrolase